MIDIQWTKFELKSIVTFISGGITLIACAYEAIVRYKHNHINNKTGGKCHASVSSLFCKTKVLLFSFN